MRLVLILVAAALGVAAIGSSWNRSSDVEAAEAEVADRAGALAELPHVGDEVSDVTCAWDQRWEGYACEITMPVREELAGPDGTATETAALRDGELWVGGVLVE